MSINKRNPVFIKGVPYALYPNYGVRGVSPYCFGNPDKFRKTRRHHVATITKL
jgi:hypothetical protein